MTIELTTESDIIAASIALGATSVSGISPAEMALCRSITSKISKQQTQTLHQQIQNGDDPLGTAFSLLRSASMRRESGATYTPAGVVQAMMAWASEQPRPDRIVDPGAGSARFLSAAGHIFKKAQLVGYEIDPLAALMARANLSAAGFSERAEIHLIDYRTNGDTFNGRTLFIGNPPYVRHHLIDSHWKQWLVATAKRYKLHASQLAGLHVYFFIATLVRAARDDRGAFITASEWLDVNYGKLMRDLFLGQLGGHSIVLIEPTASPFPDTATTAAITTFQVGSKAESIRFRRVSQMSDLNDLSGGQTVHRERLETETRWSRLTHVARERPEGFVELGELCRVHRGAVTGANAVFIANEHAADVPQRFKLRSITRARELIAAGRILSDISGLRFVVDLPDDLDMLDPCERPGVERFLTAAKAQGAHTGYVARHRRAWWSVGMRAAAPILATYMARRAPSFALNAGKARHINIAHGLYPRDKLSEAQMRALVDYLSTGISILDGRTYAGGLTKFEPREMERLYVPAPDLLSELSE